MSTSASDVAASVPAAQVDDDNLFAGLNSLKSNLAKVNQPLVPTLIELFGTFREKIADDFQKKLDTTLAAIKLDFHAVVQAKDSEISDLKISNDLLKTQVSTLKDNLDATQAYERRDTVIISGVVPAVSSGEVTSDVVVDLVKSKLPSVKIDRREISVSHRLQPKKPDAQGITPPPNIYVKLVRREMKIALIKASKAQDRNSTNRIFINESLTPQRTAVFQTLLKIKKKHDVVRGVSTMEGDVFAYTPVGEEASSSSNAVRRKDKRHLINTRDALQKFCDQYIKKSLEDFIATWPGL